MVDVAQDRYQDGAGRSAAHEQPCAGSPSGFAPEGLKLTGHGG